MNNESMSTFECFTELEAWKEARKLRIRITAIANELPKHEQFKLQDQLERAARSVTANIAEGFGRHHFQENMQYCRQARASLFEVLDHIICAFDLDYINKDTREELRLQITSCIKLLNGYLKHLRAQKKNFTMNHEP